MPVQKKIDHYWKKAGFTPTENQKQAIIHSKGPLLLTAGPGSGKTRVLLWHTVHLIVYEDIKPEEIFLSTFTEKAALQLKEGLIGLLGMVTNETGIPYDTSKMDIGTVHSICRKIITDRRFTQSGERHFNPVVKDELDQYFLLYRQLWGNFLELSEYDEEQTQRKINNFFYGSDFYSKHLAVQNCISLFNRFSEEMIKPDDVDPDDTIRDELVKMYDFYLSYLNAGNGIRIVDYSLLQQYAHDIIRACKNSNTVFKHIIIDEYQDTNSIQEKIFFELAGGYQNICVVGDDDQALYRFRGATVENLVEFPNRCLQYLKTKPRRIDLNYNFRSTHDIVSFYSAFIDKIDWKKPDKKYGCQGLWLLPFPTNSPQQRCLAPISSFPNSNLGRSISIQVALGSSIPNSYQLPAPSPLEPKTNHHLPHHHKLPHLHFSLLKSPH